MKTELTNMIMIVDKTTGKVLVQNRTKNWSGLTFPGGHVEPGESFVDSAVREAMEETGLSIHNLKGSGVIHWTNTKTHDRYLAFLYKTSDFSGDLLLETREGKNMWMTVEQLLDTPSDNGLHEIIHIFLNDELSEAFGSWSNEQDWQINEFK